MALLARFKPAYNGTDGAEFTPAWVDDAGATAPTLSSPTATGITSTGFLPRVTATGGSGGTLYWTAQLLGTNPSDVEVAGGLDGDGASLPAGQKGSLAYAGAGTIDASAPASGCSAGTGYEVAWVWSDGVTYSNVVVSGTITTAAVLAVADAAHSHAADNLTLTLSTTLVIADAFHGHTAESPAPNTSASLVVADALHGHTAENLGLSTETLLAIADALHGHTAENLGLSISDSALLAIADALHGHTAESLGLTTETLLAVADAFHGHDAEIVVLYLEGGPVLVSLRRAHMLRDMGRMMGA